MGGGVTIRYRGKYEKGLDITVLFITFQQKQSLEGTAARHYKMKKKTRGTI